MPTGRTEPPGVLYGVDIVQPTESGEGQRLITRIEIRVIIVAPPFPFSIKGGSPFGCLRPQRIVESTGNDRTISIGQGAEVFGEPTLSSNLHHVIGVPLHRGRYTRRIHGMCATPIINGGRFGVFEEGRVGASHDDLSAAAIIHIGFDFVILVLRIRTSQYIFPLDTPHGETGLRHCHIEVGRILCGTQSDPPSPHPIEGRVLGPPIALLARRC